MMQTFVLSHLPIKRNEQKEKKKKTYLHYSPTHFYFSPFPIPHDIFPSAAPRHFPASAHSSLPVSAHSSPPVSVPRRTLGMDDDTPQYSTPASKELTTLTPSMPPLSPPLYQPEHPSPIEEMSKDITASGRITTSSNCMSSSGSEAQEVESMDESEAEEAEDSEGDGKQRLPLVATVATTVSSSPNGLIHAGPLGDDCTQAPATELNGAVAGNTAVDVGRGVVPGQRFPGPASAAAGVSLLLLASTSSTLDTAISRLCDGSLEDADKMLAHALAESGAPGEGPSATSAENGRMSRNMNTEAAAAAAERESQRPGSSSRGRDGATGVGGIALPPSRRKNNAAASRKTKQSPLMDATLPLALARLALRDLKPSLFSHHIAMKLLTQVRQASTDALVAAAETLGSQAHMLAANTAHQSLARTAPAAPLGGSSVSEAWYHLLQGDVLGFCPEQRQKDGAAASYAAAQAAAERASKGESRGATPVYQLAIYRQACAELQPPRVDIPRATALLQGLAASGLAVALHALALAPLVKASLDAGQRQREHERGEGSVPMAEAGRYSTASVLHPRPDTERGLGVAALELSKESLDMLEKASEAGLPYSQHLLGLDLLMRQKRVRKGTSWLTRASDQGFVVSTVFLADHYFREAGLLGASLGEDEAEDDAASISVGSRKSSGLAAVPATFQSAAPSPLGAATGTNGTPAGTVPVAAATAEANAGAAQATKGDATAAAAKEDIPRHGRQADSQSKGTAGGKGSKAKARRNRALLLEKAASHYHIAALDGVAHAQFAYGLCLRFGLGVPADAEESQAWLERAASQRHPKALYQMGRFMIDRRARQGRLSQRGLRYLRRAYLDKVPEAALLLGRTYERTPRSVPPDPLAAMAYYDIAISLGNAEAANDLARLQARVLPDVTPEETFTTYQELAPRSSAALVNLAICYSAGYGTPVNLGNAVACAKEAMKRGFPPADNIDALLELTLARRGAEGDASSWRPSQALLRAVMPRFRRAATAGDADAQYNLARCILELKDKAPNDVNEATAYLCEAAAHGHVGAQMHVGVSMQQGDVFPRDVPNGERYIRRAREQGVVVTPTLTSSASPAVAAAAATAAAPIAGLPWPPAQVGLHHAGLRQKINPDFLSMAETPSGMLSGSPTVGHQGAPASSAGRDTLAARLNGVSPDVVKSEAERGDAHALCQLGLWYLQGMHVEANTIQGVHCFDQAARKGLASAQSHLAECYLKGVGVPPDFRLAIVWFERAAEQDEPVALCNLAHLWQQEQHSPQKLGEAAKLYERAALQGMPTAQCCLASCYFEGKGVPRSYEKAVYWWRKAQEGDVAEAWFNLGLCYLQGRGLPEDPLRARQYFLEAAVRGNVTGQCNMGVMFERGLGGAKDLRQSYAWWRRAAGKGNPAACRSVGNYMLRGIGTSRRVGEGLAFLKFAAHHRDPEAILTLAEIYELGQHGIHSSLAHARILYLDLAARGNVRAQLALARLLERTASCSPQVTLPSSGNLAPTQEAEQWYEQASRSNAPEAHYQLARFLCAHHGCARKDVLQEVASLCRRAGDQGYGPAQFCLSLCYQAGIGVDVDAHAAEMWRKKAKAASVTIKKRWPANSLEGMLSAAYWAQGAPPDVLPAEGATPAHDTTPSVLCPPSPTLGKPGPFHDEDQARQLAKRGGVGGEGGGGGYAPGGDKGQPAAKRPHVVS